MTSGRAKKFTGEFHHEPMSNPSLTQLARDVGRTLINNGTTVSIAESCTGGLLCHLLTDVPGISAVLKEGLVSYSKAAKQKRLGVSQKLLRKHGAVSAPVAISMAKRARLLLGADIGLAITGIAGPSSPEPGKPVGLVFVAISSRPEKKIHYQKFLFSGTRLSIKKQAARAALLMLAESITRSRDRKK
jgi:PncC family amidohydrolase